MFELNSQTFHMSGDHPGEQRISVGLESGTPWRQAFKKRSNQPTAIISKMREIPSVAPLGMFDGCRPTILHNR